MRRRTLMTAALAALALPAPARAQAAFTLAPIEPANALEHAFLAALDNAALRPAFRRQLLDSQVALALANDAADSPPRLLNLAGGRAAAGIFTSAARLSGVLGPAAARAMLPGRQALERLRGRHVVINYRLLPMLTLEAEDVALYLETPA